MHIMKLREKYFDFIKYGTKIYEIRLNDDKRKIIKIGDFVEFQKEPLKEEKIIYKVDDLLYFKNFNELLNSIDIKYLVSSSESKNELLESLNTFYSLEEQERYGVVAIKLDKNITIEKCLLSSIEYDNEVFDNVKKNYKDSFDWYNKLCLNNEVCYITKSDNKITSIILLKENEIDSQQIDLKNVLKIRTMNVIDKNKGIGKLYLEFINKFAKYNNNDYVYLTCNKENNEFINFIEHNGFKMYKEYLDEFVYVREVK